MNQIRIVYTDGTEDKFSCEDCYYDEMGEIFTVELDEWNKVDIMIPTVRKIYITEPKDV